MTDSELLERAAQAAGIDLQHRTMFGGDAEPGYYRSGRWEWWNPLTDDGDALRLSATRGIDIEWEGGVVFADGNFSEPCGDDRSAAARRAIVRAAAAMVEQP